MSPHSRPPGVLSPLNLAMLQAIVEFKQAHDGNSPTVRELKALLGLSSESSVKHHLAALTVAGRIKQLRFKSRGIEVVGARWAPPGLDPAQNSDAA